MKSLVVFYSRDGHTRKVAERIAAKLMADIREIKEKKNRKGFLGYLLAGRDAMKQKDSLLVDTDTNISQYDAVFFGAPIWGWKPAPATMTFIKNCDLYGKKVVNFVTMGGSCGKSLEMMKEAAEESGGEVLGGKSIITNGVSEDKWLKEGDKVAGLLK